MLTNFSSKISIPVRKEIVRFVLSAFIAWVVSVVFNDLPVFVNYIHKTGFDVLLQNIYVFLTEKFLNLLQFKTYSSGAFLQIEGTYGIRFLYDCLAIRHLLLFGVFVLFYFGKWMTKIWYILMGSVIILIINVIRATSLCIIQATHPDWFNIWHEKGGIVLMYIPILILWLIWIDKYGRYEAKQKVINKTKMAGD